MLVTIWMWTHEWSLISIRATAFTFETCHHPFSCLSSFTRSIERAQLAVAADGDVDPHPLDRLGGGQPRFVLGLLGDGLLDPISRFLVDRHGAKCSRACIRPSIRHHARMNEHPVRLIVDDDLRRNRLTVFFRLILAIPHLIWASLWSMPSVVAAVVNWFATLVTGKPPTAIHNFLRAYIALRAHLSAYLCARRQSLPGLRRRGGRVPDRRELPAAAAQSRWKVLLRIFLVVPAIAPRSALGGAGGAPSAAARGNAAHYSAAAAAARSAPSARCSAGSRASPAAACRRAFATRARTASATARRCSPTSSSSPTAIRTPTRRRCSRRSSGRRSIRCTSSATRTISAARA